ncbi:ABC transporter permease [Aliiruegeria haliotis]|nr:ABC transporter permease [Aliiruegeria haliotis]
MDELLKPVSRPRSFKTSRTIVALILREMQTTYGRNAGGYLWAILNPVGALAMFVLVIAVGLRIRTPGLGTNFPLFYATGYLPLQLTLTTISKVAGSLNYSKPLLNYPGVQYTDAIIARFVLNFITQCVVGVIIFVGIHVLWDLNTIRNLPAIVASFVLAAFVGLGIGVLNCFLFSVSSMWQSTWGILTRPLFLLSCIFFIFEDVPSQYQDGLWWNPLIHVVGLMRRGFYATYEAPYVSIVYLVSVSLICMTLGLLFLNRFHLSILNR